VWHDYRYAPAMLRYSFLCASLLVACTAGSASETDQSGAAVTESLIVPSAILNATLIVKPSPIDQSSAGIVLAEGVAYADGATSESLPEITTAAGRKLTDLPSATVTVGDEHYGAARVSGMPVAPLLDPSAVVVGKTCTVLGTDLDMYSSGPSTLITLKGSVDRVRNGDVLVKTTKSTGGEMSLLICDGKLAGIGAGAGSQGTYHEFHVLDDETLKAFAARFR
jgi:hypothetical protein